MQRTFPSAPLEFSQSMTTPSPDTRPCAEQSRWCRFDEIQAAPERSRVDSQSPTGRGLLVPADSSLSSAQSQAMSTSGLANVARSSVDKASLAVASGAPESDASPRPLSPVVREKRTIDGTSFSDDGGCPEQVEECSAMSSSSQPQSSPVKMHDARPPSRSLPGSSPSSPTREAAGSPRKRQRQAAEASGAATATVRVRGAIPKAKVDRFASKATIAIAKCKDLCAILLARRDARRGRAVAIKAVAEAIEAASAGAAFLHPPPQFLCCQSISSEQSVQSSSPQYHQLHSLSTGVRTSYLHGSERLSLPPSSSSSSSSSFVCSGSHKTIELTADHTAVAIAEADADADADAAGAAEETSVDVQEFLGAAEELVRFSRLRVLTGEMPEELAEETKQQRQQKKTKRHAFGEWTVEFVAEGHRYIVRRASDGSIVDTTGLVSTTEYASSLFPKFHGPTALRSMRPENREAKYAGMSDEEILKYWERNGERAAALGTVAHAYMEACMNSEMALPGVLFGRAAEDYPPSPVLVPDGICDRQKLEAVVAKIESQFRELVLVRSRDRDAAARPEAHPDYYYSDGGGGDVVVDDDDYYYCEDNAGCGSGSGCSVQCEEEPVSLAEEEGELVLDVTAVAEFFSEVHRAGMVPSAAEMVMYDHEIRVSGSADAAFDNPATKERWLVDWKRRDKYTTPGRFSKPGFEGTPGSGMVECHETMATFQLNTYRGIMERAGMRAPKRLSIVSIHPRAERDASGRVVVHDIPIDSALFAAVVRHRIALLSAAMESKEECATTALDKAIPADEDVSAAAVAVFADENAALAAST